MAMKPRKMRGGGMMKKGSSEMREEKPMKKMRGGGMVMKMKKGGAVKGACKVRNALHVKTRPLRQHSC